MGINGDDKRMYYDTQHTYLQVDTGIQDGISNLGHGARHEEACGNDADHGSEGQDGLDEFGEELVGRHPDGDGSEDDLFSIDFLGLVFEV